jgi:hypothetical protein
MDNFALGELIELFKRGILWIIITVIFTSHELKEEASKHCYSGIISVPGVFYGFNPIRGYQAIGRLFPGRCGMVRLDYILGYVKSLLITACVLGLILLAAKYLHQPG